MRLLTLIASRLLKRRCRMALVELNLGGSLASVGTVVATCERLHGHGGRCAFHDKHGQWVRW